MLIREAGIIFNGVPLIFTHYHKANKDGLELISTSKLMSGLLIFAECLVAPIEYFENSKYTIVFKKGEMDDYYGNIREVFAFLVVDKQDRLEKYLDKIINPFLEKLLEKFISQFYGCKITEVAQFEPFKKIIDTIIY